MANSAFIIGTGGGGGGGAPIIIKDEGTTITSAASSLNFVGSSVSASASGNDVTVVVAVSGSALVVQDEGSTLTSNTALINFVGTGVTATAAGDNVTVTINSGSGGSGSGVTVKDEGSILTTGVSSIDFIGSGVTATTTGSAVTVNIPGGGSGSADTASNIGTGAGLVFKQKTSGNYEFRKILAGANISVATVGDDVVISGSAGGGAGGGSGNTDPTFSSGSFIVNHAYITTAAATGSLPTTSGVGDVIKVVGNGLWKVAQNSGQLIHFGMVQTTTGTSGYIQATYKYDVMELTCIVANTEWIVSNSVGNLYLN